MKVIDLDSISMTDMEIIMCNGSYFEVLKTMLKKIDDAPSFEIIKCKECKYYYPGCVFPCDLSSEILVKDDDFCSKAEKREENE